MALSVIQLPNFYFWKCSAQKKGPQISSRQGPDGPLLSISSAPLQKCSTFRYDSPCRTVSSILYRLYRAHCANCANGPLFGMEIPNSYQRPGKPPGACPELASGSCTGPGTRTANPRSWPTKCRGSYFNLPLDPVKTSGSDLNGLQALCSHLSPRGRGRGAKNW